MNRTGKPDTERPAESYRSPMPVTQRIRYPDALFYLCPGCRVALEREFMAFCDRCGQRLDWKQYRKAELITAGRQKTQ